MREKAAAHFTKKINRCLFGSCQWWGQESFREFSRAFLRIQFSRSYTSLVSVLKFSRQTLWDCKFECVYNHGVHWIHLSVAASRKLFHPPCQETRDSLHPVIIFFFFSTVVEIQSITHLVDLGTSDLQSFFFSFSTLLERATHIHSPWIQLSLLARSTQFPDASPSMALHFRWLQVIIKWFLHQCLPCTAKVGFPHTGWFLLPASLTKLENQFQLSSIIVCYVQPLPEPISVSVQKEF